MRRALFWAGLLVLTPAAFARAQEEPVSPAGGFGRRAAPPACCPPVQGWPVYPAIPSTTPPGMPPDVAPPLAPPGGDQLADRFASAFATQTGQGGLQGRSVNEEYDGDNVGVFYRLRVVTGSTIQRVQTGTTTQIIRTPNGIFTRIVPVFANVAVPTTRTVRVPVAGRYAGVQVTENESPRPDDRVYFGYNYYDQVGATLNPGFGNVIQHRMTIGFEKTLLDGAASVGMRLPFVQLTGPAGVGGDSVGDLTILTKLALLNDRDGMNFFTVGFAVTAPTGARGGVLADGTPIPHSVLLQPWVGLVRSFDRFYIQDITNVIVPTDSRDILLLGNSLAAGYWLYRGNTERFLPALTPTAEFHIRTPLTNRGPDSLVYMPDQVNITSGLHFRWPRAVLSGAVCVPVVGPRPWNVEGIFHFNIRY
jgi:hypothetical protein